MATSNSTPIYTNLTDATSFDATHLMFELVAQRPQLLGVYRTCLETLQSPLINDLLDCGDDRLKPKDGSVEIGVGGEEVDTTLQSRVTRLIREPVSELIHAEEDAPQCVVPVGEEVFVGSNLAYPIDYSVVAIIGHIRQ
jgi:hypothetical protein